MKLLDLTLPSPEENLACDEALLDGCEEDGADEVLRFWEPDRRFVVVGYSNRVSAETDEAACRREKIPILRRCSGGGAVLQAPGCLDYALVLRIGGSDHLADVSKTNRFIMQRHAAAIGPLIENRAVDGSRPGGGPAVRVEGTTDLAMDGWKFSGNAQRRKRRYLLFHGTFLLGCDLAWMEKVLPMPSRQPGYRRNRSHGAFVANVPVAGPALKDALARAWGVDGPFEAMPTARIEELVAVRYRTPEWNCKF